MRSSSELGAGVAGSETRLPAAMLERFTGSAAERMAALLRFLSPITGGQVQAP